MVYNFVCECFASNEPGSSAPDLATLSFSLFLPPSFSLSLARSLPRPFSAVGRYYAHGQRYEDACARAALKLYVSRIAPPHEPSARRRSVFGILSSVIHNLSVRRYICKDDSIIVPSCPSSPPLYCSLKGVLRRAVALATTSHRGRVTNANLCVSREPSIGRS